jgi:anion-transporting  ArsA/GET3 family ATPase
VTKTPEIFLLCGSGGVGKTTMSAALGLKFANLGQKTIVLTIDPAKRLATSLGLKELSDTPKKIPIPRDLGSGEMFAMMLDTKRTFDRIVEKYAPNPEARARILKNKVYQHMSSMLAGSQEYMAMERLYEIQQQNFYDVIIVDTPPMQNAIDFLQAPDKLSNMISNSMLHLLLKPTLAIGKTGFKFFERGSQQILKILDRIVGFAFLQDISEMLVAFQELLGGFNERAKLVRELLKNHSTHFIAVCTTQENSVAETEDFADKLKSFEYHLKKIIVNRVYSGKASTQDKVTTDKKDLRQFFKTEDVEVLVENYEKFLPLIRRDARQIAKLSQRVGKNNLDAIPLFLSDIHDLAGLSEIAKFLE